MTTSGTLHDADLRPATAWLAYRPGPWLALVAAPVLLVAPLVTAIAAGDWARAGYVVLIGAVFGIAVLLPFGSRRRPTAVTEAVFVALLLLCTGYLVLWPTGQALLFPLLAVAASLAIRRRWAMGVVGAVAVSGALAVGFETWSLEAAVLVGFAAFAGGAATTSCSTTWRWLASSTARGSSLRSPPSPRSACGSHATCTTCSGTPSRSSP